MIKSSAAPPRPQRKAIFVAFLGSFSCILLLGLLTHYEQHLWIMAPFGATCVLAFALPESPLAQPRHILGGHLVTAVIGLIVLHFLGTGIFSLALAVALGIVAMQILRVTHPPAGANPLVIFALQPSWLFLVFPVLLGSLIIIGVTYLCHRASKRIKYPVYWW